MYAIRYQHSFFARDLMAFETVRNSAKLAYSRTRLQPSCLQRREPGSIIESHAYSPYQLVRSVTPANSLTTTYETQKCRAGCSRDRLYILQTQKTTACVGRMDR